MVPSAALLMRFPHQTKLFFSTLPKPSSAPTASRDFSARGDPVINRSSTWATITPSSWRLPALEGLLHRNHIALSICERSHPRSAGLQDNHSRGASAIVPSPDLKQKYDEAAIAGWKAYIDNQAVEPLDVEASMRVRKDLAARGESARILKHRFVLTDKHDGLRTATNPLDVQASARLVVPGYKDHSNLSGKLRRDAPTGSRLAHNICFSASLHTIRAGRAGRPVP